MKCYKCNAKASVNIDNQDFCNACFCEIIEKRVRKEIRQEKLINKNDKILIIDDSTPISKSTLFLLKRIIKDPTIKMQIKKQAKENEEDYKIIPAWSLDDEIENYLKSLFENKKITTLHHGKIIKPLVNITRDEAIKFSKINKLDFKERKIQTNDVSIIIDNLEKKYPGTKFGILKTIRNLR